MTGSNTTSRLMLLLARDCIQTKSDRLTVTVTSLDTIINTAHTLNFTFILTNNETRLVWFTDEHTYAHTHKHTGDDLNLLVNIVSYHKSLTELLVQGGWVG